MFNEQLTRFAVSCSHFGRYHFDFRQSIRLNFLVYFYSYLHFALKFDFVHLLQHFIGTEWRCCVFVLMLELELSLCCCGGMCKLHSIGHHVEPYRSNAWFYQASTVPDTEFVSLPSQTHFLFNTHTSCDSSAKQDKLLYDVHRSTKRTQFVW